MMKRETKGEGGDKGVSREMKGQEEGGEWYKKGNNRGREKGLWGIRWRENDKGVCRGEAKGYELRKT